MKREIAMTASTTGLVDLTVHEVKLTELKPYGKNPRVGNVQAIAQSLQVNGQYRPIVVRKETDEILAGNHTWKAAKFLNWNTIKVTYLEGLTDEQASRIVLADNRYSDIATYDDKALAELLATVTDVSGTGYTASEASAFIDSILGTQPPTALTDVDDIPDVPKKPISNVGDVWILGDHRLIVGDSTDPTVYDRLMAGDKADLVLTDPPYNVAIVGGTKDKLTIQNDSMTDDNFAKFLFAAFKCMFDASRAGAPAYIFHADSEAGPFHTQFAGAGWMVKQVLVWVKNSLVLSRQDYHWQHEPVLYGWKPGAAHPWLADRKQTTVIDEGLDASSMTKDELVDLALSLFEQSTVLRADKPSRNADHPTMKPVGLVSKLLLNSSDINNLILDPFGGSGSTLIAAHTNGRRARLIELDPKYADVICRRYEAHTGTLPVLESTKQAFSFIDESK